MPHEPIAPPGTRIFARIDRFHCECPSCGSLIVGDLDPRRSQRRDILAKRANHQHQRRTRNQRRKRQTARQRARANRAHPYNPFLQTLTCPSCGRVFIVGLLLWSPVHGAWKVRQPTDTQPTRRQLAELRAIAESRWAFKQIIFGDEVNVAVDGECPCTPDHRDPACPVHGDDGSRE